MLELLECYNVRIKYSIFNQCHFFKIKIKDSGVLNFSFLKMNHFEDACMGRVERTSNISTFCIRNNHP